MISGEETTLQAISFRLGVSVDFIEEVSEAAYEKAVKS